MTELLQFEKNLQHVTNLKNLNLALEQHLRSLAITTFSFTYYSRHPNSSHKLKYDFCSANYRSWHEFYLSEHYEEIDSTLVKEHQQTLPLFWDIQQQLTAAKSEREKKMRLDSLAFGVEKGLSIPIHGAHEDFANLLVIQMQGEKCLEDWQNKKYLLLCTAHLFYHYLQPLLVESQSDSISYHLTQREIQCLLLTAKHYSVPTIAEKLQLSERTVNFHLQKANKKLGVHNKHQAVAKALEKSLITI